MNITDEFREMIVKEIDFVVEKMKETTAPSQKLYYFSGIFALIQRLFNMAYDEELLYIHFVLQNVHRSFIGRIQGIEQGKDLSVPLYEEHFSKLIELVKQLQESIQQKKALDDTLRGLAILSYSLTGNGFYLLQKGFLKLRE